MMAVVMGRAKELVMEREASVLADAEDGERGEAFPYQVGTAVVYYNQVI